MRRFILILLISLLSIYTVRGQEYSREKQIIRVFCDKNYFPVESALKSDPKSPYAAFFSIWLKQVLGENKEIIFRDFETFPELYRQKEMADIIIALPSRIKDSFPNKSTIDLPFIYFKTVSIYNTSQSESIILDMTKPSFETIDSAIQQFKSGKISTIKTYAPTFFPFPQNEWPQKINFDKGYMELKLIINSENLFPENWQEGNFTENEKWIKEQWGNLFSGKYYDTGLGESYQRAEFRETITASSPALVTIQGDVHSELFSNESEENDFIDILFHEIELQTGLKLIPEPEHSSQERTKNAEKVETALTIPGGYILYTYPLAPKNSQISTTRIACRKEDFNELTSFYRYDSRVDLIHFSDLESLYDAFENHAVSKLVYPVEKALSSELKEALIPETIIPATESLIHLFSENQNVSHIISNTLEQISPEQIFDFYQTALNANTPLNTNASLDGLLDPEENRWLGQNPYMFYTEKELFKPFFMRIKSENRGLLPDIMKEISRISGIQFIWVRSDLQQGEDTYFPTYFGRLNAVLIPEKKMEQNSLYLPLISIKQIIISRKFDSNRFYSVESLKGRKVIVLEEYLAGSQITDLYPANYEFINVARVEDGFSLLKKGFADAFFLDEITAAYYLNSFRNNSIIISGELPESINLVLECSDFDQFNVLKKTKDSIQDEKLHRILQHWLFSYINGAYYSRNLLIIILFSIIILMLTILFWALKLKARINRISRSEKKLKSGQDELTRAREEAIEAMKKASEANRSKTIFLTNMSHEIRTPMNSVLGFTDILLESGVNEEQKEHLSLIRSAARNLLTIINDILDLSKIEAGKMEIIKRPVHLLELLNEIVTFFSPAIKEAGLKFSVRIDNDIPSFLYLDEVRIRQILINLVGNAVKFTESGEIILEVQSHFYQQDNDRIHLLFNVKDTGIGIPFEQQQKIFNMFEQQEGQDSSRFKGTGLGLAICRSLVEMMNGRISVESSPGEGSVFSVHLFHVKISEENDSESTEEYSELPVEPFSGKWKILVFDSSRSSLKKMKGYLEMLNIQASFSMEFGDWSKMLEKNNHFDLLIMDLKSFLKQENHYQRAMESWIKNSETPVIIIDERTGAGEIPYSFIRFTLLRKPIWIHILKQNITRLLAPDYSETIESPYPESDNSAIPLSNIDLDTVIAEIKKVKSSGDFEMIGQFAQKIESYDSTPGIGLFSEYSRKLRESVKNFDPEKTNRILENLLSYVEGIEK